MKISSLQKGLVAHWTMSQDSLKGSLLADKTPYENDGTIYGATFTTDRKGQANKAMSFDGVDDYVNTAININGSKTFSLWARSNIANDSMVALFGVQSPDAGDRYYLGFNSSGVLGCGIGPLSWINNYTDYKLDTNWHNYILTSEGTNHNLYVDGVLIKEITGVVLSDDTNSYYLGALHYLTDKMYFFNGSIDDVRIYNRALSQAEITTLYNSYNSKIQL